MKKWYNCPNVVLVAIASVAFMSGYMFGVPGILVVTMATAIGCAYGHVTVRGGN